jgi:AcrR family transcriptional regulator
MRMASDVPRAIIRAAEDLFAQRGSDSVSLRDIQVAARATNASAVQYHFGGRAGLMKAILAKHHVDVERRRHALLDEYEYERERETHAGAGAEPDIRALAAAVVEPLAAELDNEDGGRGYLQLVSDLYNRPNPTFDPSALEDERDSFQRWRRLAAPVLSPDALRLHRRYDALRFTVFELARRGRSGRKDHRLFTSQLTDLVAALLTAPVSEETHRLIRR